MQLLTTIYLTFVVALRLVVYLSVPVEVTRGNCAQWYASWQVCLVS